MSFSHFHFRDLSEASPQMLVNAAQSLSVRSLWRGVRREGLGKEGQGCAVQVTIHHYPMSRKWKCFNFKHFALELFLF